ncbi:hypothetical protein D3C72_2181060 [compost metagenome]
MNLPTENAATSLGSEEGRRSSTVFVTALCSVAVGALPDARFFAADETSVDVM